jgi:hypothetical protein
MVLGSPSISNDAQTSAYFPGVNTAYLKLPAGVLGLGPPAVATIGGIFMTVLRSNIQAVCSFDQAHGCSFQLQASTGSMLCWLNSGEYSLLGYTFAVVPIFWALVMTAAPVTTLYLGAIPVLDETAPAAGFQTATETGAFGLEVNGGASNYPFLGYMADMFVTTTALTQAQLATVQAQLVPV